MNIFQRLSLFWRRFSPLEERLLAAVSGVLPPPARRIFEAQVAGITTVRRIGNEICVYRMASGKVDWSEVPSFPNTDEFPLAKVRFSAGGRRFKATLYCVGGHAFDFTILPNPKGMEFATWDDAPATTLMRDPMITRGAAEPSSLPAVWQEFLTRGEKAPEGWKLHDGRSAYRITCHDAEYLVLAERGGDQFVLQQIDPAVTSLYYLDSHDGVPEAIDGDVRDALRTE
jgi:hypothetical protein